MVDLLCHKFGENKMIKLLRPLHAMRYRDIHITTPSTLSNARQNEIKTLLFIRAQHYSLLSGCPQYELRPWFRLISPASPVLGTGLCLLPNERDNRPDN